jgi:hypothetical protein
MTPQHVTLHHRHGRKEDLVSALEDESSVKWLLCLTPPSETMAHLTRRVVLNGQHVGTDLILPADLQVMQWSCCSAPSVFVIICDDTRNASTNSPAYVMNSVKQALDTIVSPVVIVRSHVSVFVISHCLEASWEALCCLKDPGHIDNVGVIYPFTGQHTWGARLSVHSPISVESCRGSIAAILQGGRFSKSLLHLKPEDRVDIARPDTYSKLVIQLLAARDNISKKPRANTNDTVYLLSSGSGFGARTLQTRVGFDLYHDGAFQRFVIFVTPTPTWTTRLQNQRQWTLVVRSFAWMLQHQRSTLRHSTSSNNSV